jgi:hypothetical protein
MEARQQGLQHERYWTRAVNEALQDGEVRDQAVANALRKWCADHSPDSPLIGGICGSEQYSKVWFHLAPWYIGPDAEEMRLLCGQVFSRVLKLHGAASSFQSPGFCDVWGYATRYSNRAAINCGWLKDRISEAASVSIAMVVDLWSYWGVGTYALLLPKDVANVRRHIFEALRASLCDGASLRRALHPSIHYLLYGLVFNPDDEGVVSEYAGVKAWHWLGPPILDALALDDVTVAIELCRLISRRGSPAILGPAAVDPSTMRGLFGANAPIALDAVERLAPQMSSEDSSFASAVVRAARIAIAVPDGDG